MEIEFQVFNTTNGNTIHQGDFNSCAILLKQLGGDYHIRETLVAEEKRKPIRNNHD